MGRPYINLSIHQSCRFLLWVCLWLCFCEGKGGPTKIEAQEENPGNKIPCSNRNSSTPLPLFTTVAKENRAFLIVAPSHWCFKDILLLAIKIIYVSILTSSQWTPYDLWICLIFFSRCPKMMATTIWRSLSRLVVTSSDPIIIHCNTAKAAPWEKMGHCSTPGSDHPTLPYSPPAGLSASSYYESGYESTMNTNE